MFPRNFWYVAAWDWEVRRQELFHRTICAEPGRARNDTR